MTAAITLMVLFSIQRLENQKTRASFLKLEELLHPKENHPDVVSPEKLTDAELDEFEHELQKLPKKFSASIEADRKSVQEERARRAASVGMKN
jgi:low affinity Fe/Cu permease